ncbi:MAG: sigma-70 family RNA polymerase sigma factor [Chitinophagaceae bacterium]|nr:sigma-70 family RNA polymerase sigma factor [Chitinophagaceae bacterium]
MHNQTELLLRVSNGDERAFREIYDAYSATAYNTIKRYIPDPDDCAEIFQQVFIQLWEKRSRVSEIENIADYLFVMTRNRVFRHLHNLRRQSEILHHVKSETEHLRSGNNNTLLLQQYQRWWDEAIDALTPNQKQVYLLIEKEELNLDEVAGKLGIAKATVKKHLELGRRSVRQIMSQRIKTEDLSPDLVVAGCFFINFF